MQRGETMVLLRAGQGLGQGAHHICVVERWRVVGGGRDFFSLSFEVKVQVSK
jgi:hypothetical protein